jgi:DNA-binding MarR family transcriptional regulator
MQVTKSAVSQLVTWLEEHGLVERVPDPADRRATLVRATRAADAGFTVARHRYAEIEDEWERVIGVDGLASLAKTLQQLESARPPKARSHRKRGRSGSSRATRAPRS